MMEQGEREATEVIRRSNSTLGNLYEEIKAINIMNNLTAEE